MPLPFRDQELSLPNNKSVALRRLGSLIKRFDKDKKFRSHYSDFMQRLIDNDHAEKIPSSETDADSGRVWYVPHHGVYHPKKPDKIRVVFDCSVSYQGHCLNSYLLQGPDLTNKLIGVLTRFRKERVAIMCDIEQMFNQFRVIPEHRDFLRFLWWSGEDYHKPPEDFRMKVHLFGATSSPGCANFGLKRLASENEVEFGSDVTSFIHRDFYVDDGLKSFPTAKEAVSLIDKSKELCSKGGLRLHKFVSNDKDVIAHFDPSDRAKDLKDINLLSDKLPIERALGIQWCTESDTFQFKIEANDRPLNRRGILSAVGSLYDPLGFISPVVLIAKQILQQLCSDNLGWDDPLPDYLRVKWEKWRASLAHLDTLRIKRCLKPEGFGEVVSAELHHFSDASSTGYGQCSYIRLVNAEGSVHCSFLFGKSRVIPLKPITIPRLELSAALLSIRVSLLLEQELDLESVKHFYWTDSRVVLGYIANESKRFHVFVANRIQQIRDHSEVSQWKYVESAQNPADIASRGVNPEELTSNSPWFVGPDFLWSGTLPNAEIEAEVHAADPEVKCVKTLATGVKEIQYPCMIDRLSYFSDWHRAKRAFALCLRFRDKLFQKYVHTRNTHNDERQKQHFQSLSFSHYQSPSVSKLQAAELQILKLLQSMHFQHEIATLKRNSVRGSSDRNTLKNHRKILKRESHLLRLDPFLDQDGIIRVGGRIRQLDVPSNVKHPIIVPKEVTLQT
ncbi:uncharacterized protein LOC128556932 [Mercenaria mercenaria]|uniref:uncharacterized protein LOC128556932 n=1 Tax=Mercenaria mercenaria TaxID=6596 RepID=UPI00234FA15B|nr:uncharacterized protein LOC128556932 [Mercenaria mercenaria]